MRILEGVGTLVQLGGLMARLCKLVGSSSFLITLSDNKRIISQGMKPELFKITK